MTTLDGLGRVIISQTEQGPGSSSYDSVQTTYDSLGRVVFVTLPYAAGKGASCSGSCPGKSTAYDALNRVVGVSDSGSGSATYTYTNNDAYQTIGPAPTGENTKQKQFEYDGLGRLASVCEITGTTNGGGTCSQKNSKTGYWTKYAYDALADLTGVTQNAQGTTQQARSYVYDMLGRLTSETNPENGTTAYVYDADSTCGTYNGNQVKRTDNATNVTCYAYDLLHRVTTITYPSGPNHSNTPTKNFVYDSATVNNQTMPNAGGRLAEAYTGSSSSKITDRGYGYSVRGEITDIYSSTTNSSGYYHITKSYWPQGALATLGNIPGVPTLYYGASDGSGLDGEGRVTKVSASSGQNPVTSVTYTTSGTTEPIGSLTQVTYGSGDSDQFSYDTNTGRMMGFQFNVGNAGLAMIGTLTWNQNGTLQKLNLVDPFATSPAIQNQTCTYNYDDLARVGGTGGVSCVDGSLTTWQQTFSPDVFGNVTKSGSSSWGCATCYDQTTNHYNTTLNGQITYDNDGNLTNDTFHQYQWDAEGHPIGIDSSSTQTYDALGNMVELSQTGWLAQYLYDENGYEYGESRAGANAFAMIGVPGGGRVLYDGGALQNYGHADWLGSLLLTSSASQTYVGGSYRAPYGEQYTVAHGNNVLNYFAGIGQNIEADLWDATYREYHATQGRWISPDPAGMSAADPSNPQTWNRYAYVGNNPLSAVDPTGQYLMLCEDPWGGGFDYGFEKTTSLGYPGLACGPFEWELPIIDPGDRGHGGGGGNGGGSGGGAGSGSPGGPAGPPLGVWQEKDTFGLPPRVVYGPLDLGSLLGLTPGTECDFGVCVPIGGGFQGGPVEVAGATISLWESLAAWGILYEVFHPGRASQLPLPLPPLPRVDPICTEGFKADLAECLEKYPHDLAKREACYAQAEENLQRCINRLPPGPHLP